MKGVILAGGTGSRLHPLTRVTNKHLLPVFDRPMIFFPLQTLVNAGIEDIMIVTGGRNSGDFLRLLGNGKDFGLKHINYSYQEGEGGIADALSLAEHFVAADKVVVFLGDNFVQESLAGAVRDFEAQPSGAKILLKEVERPESFGVAEIVGDRVVAIEEKPEKPKSNLAVIGIYMYDSHVWDIVKTLEPSRRGELEITDVNNAYVERGQMTFEVLKGWWADCGESFDSYLEAQNFAARAARKSPKG